MLISNKVHRQAATNSVCISVGKIVASHKKHQPPKFLPMISHPGDVTDIATVQQSILCYSEQLEMLQASQPHITLQAF
jgi:hypothetical protein